MQLDELLEIQKQNKDEENFSVVCCTSILHENSREYLENTGVSFYKYWSESPVSGCVTVVCLIFCLYFSISIRW